jgi:nitrogen fixation NifU-like protein
VGSDFYREIILDYYQHPRNFGRLADADIRANDSNPLCGDKVEIYLKLEGDRVKVARFTGQGCAISQASASMLMESVEGMKLEELKELSKEDILEMLGNPELGPSRIKCALLPLKVLKLGLYTYLAEKAGEQVVKEDRSSA